MNDLFEQRIIIITSYWHVYFACYSECICIINMNVYNRIYIIVHIFELSWVILKAKYMLKTGWIWSSKYKNLFKTFEKNKSRPADKMLIQDLLVFWSW